MGEEPLNFRHDIGAFSLPARYAQVRALIDQGCYSGQSLFSMSGLFQSCLSMMKHHLGSDKKFEEAFKPFKLRLDNGAQLKDQEMWDVIALIEESASRNNFWTYPEDEYEEMTVPGWNQHPATEQPASQPS